MALSRFAAAGVLALGLTAGPALADDVSAAMTARKAHMQLYAFNLGVLGNMVRGNIPFDAAASQAAADNLAALSQLSQANYWLPGSDAENLEGSRLKPELFDNVDDAVAKGQALSEAAVALAGMADTLDGLRAGIGPVGGACGACHRAYRVPDN